MSKARRGLHTSGPLGAGTFSVESLGTRAIDYEDNGKTFILDVAAGGVVALPLPKAGQKYKFVTGASLTGTYKISATSALLNGNITEAAGVQAVTAATTLTVEPAAESIGDYFTVESDGALWFVSGSYALASSITPS